MLNPTEALVDAASYETLQKDNPALLESIQQVLSKGVSAKGVEKWARHNYGRNNLMALLVAGAAHHIERQEKAQC